jgi:hypothetical protein
MVYGGCSTWRMTQVETRDLASVHPQKMTAL